MCRSIEQLPTIAENVKGYEASTWYGLLAPSATPMFIVTRLREAVVRILAVPAMRGKLGAQGFEPVGGTPAEFSAYIKSEIAKWGRVIRDAGIKPE